MEQSAWAMMIAASAAFIFNFPFGVLRAGTKTFSVKWFLYIHLPVFAVIPIRIGTGLSYWSIPVLVVFSILGQFIGSRVGRRFSSR